MGRRENPLDPTVGPVQAFAVALRELRAERGGVTYRAMAERVPYSAPALSQAASGTSLPSLPVTLAYVTALGGDPAEWERRWHEAAAAAAEGDDGDRESPYRGLTPFEVGDTAWFHGRDTLVAELLNMVTSHRLVALVGPSGSGKSSLLRAGLAPRLGGEVQGGEVRIITPGEHPLRSHTFDDENATLLLDQFEEVFTLCVDPDERAAFLDLLLSGCCFPESRRRVVIAMRADFYGRCAEHRTLAETLRQATVLVGPLNATELRQVIVKPAVTAGLTVERALTARIVEDVAGEPGALPLVSHVLLETWRRRRGRTLTLAGYEAAGGVRGALATTAERVYAELSPEQATLARRALLRLITPGEGAQDTRRPAARSEFGADADTELVLERLAGARLVTIDDEVVDLAHEALITAWPRLREWIEEDRQALRHHRQLTAAARTWEELGRDPGALYRGVRLAVTREWEATREDLSTGERAFLTASIELADREHRAAARRHRRVRYVAVVLAVLLTLTTVAGVVAFRAKDRAEQAQRDAVSRQLAAEARVLAESRPSTAKLLSVEAFRTAPTSEARGTLLSLSARTAYQAELSGHSDAVSEVRISGSGDLLAMASKDQTVSVWDLRSRERLAVLSEHATWLRTVAFSPDERMLASGGDDGRIVLWSADTFEPIATFPAHAGRVWEVVFSPDGRTLASAGDDGVVTLWNLAGRTRQATLAGHAGLVREIVFSPDGRMIASGGLDHTVRLWDSTTGENRAVYTGHTERINDVVFAPDGRSLASASADGTVWLWDTVMHTALRTMRGGGRPALAVAFSPDGHLLAVAHDNTVILSDPRDGVQRGRLTGHTDAVYSMAFHPRLPLLVSVGEEGVAILWDPLRLPLAGHSGSVNAVAFSRDGTTMATASDDRTVILWDLRSRRPLASLRHAGPVNAVAFSPDGRTLLTGSGSTTHTTGLVDHAATLWDLTDREEPVKLTELAGHTERVQAVAFTPDGRTLVTAGIDRTAILWSARDHSRKATLRQDFTVENVALSPDSRTLVTGGHSDKAVLWSVADGSRLATLAHSGYIGGTAFSPDGRTLATASTDRTIALWSLPDRARVATLTHTESLNAVAFSPDGDTLAVGGKEQTIGLWDPATGTRLATLTGHTAPVRAVAFGPDGTTLATTSIDRTAHLWHTDPGQAIEETCATLGRDLTAEERAQFLPELDRHGTC